MNNHFISHIIRDVFDKTQFTIYYGKNIELVNTLRTSEHGIGAFHIHSEHEIYNIPDSIYWNAGVDDLYFAEKSCDLFININYTPKIEDYSQALHSISKCMKPGGIIFACNCDKIFSNIPDTFVNRLDLVKELKRYKIFTSEKVEIYESI